MKLVFYISFFSLKKKEKVAATPFEEGSYTFQASISEWKMLNSQQMYKTGQELK